EFTVRLPLQPEPKAIRALPDMKVPGRLKLRVLIVEDNQDAADSLRMVLELFGCEVTVALTGPAGIEAARDWRPDIVLCDIGLPGLDGYGVIQQLRRDPLTASARMI